MTALVSRRVYSCLDLGNMLFVFPINFAFLITINYFRNLFLGLFAIFIFNFKIKPTDIYTKFDLVCFIEKKV